MKNSKDGFSKEEVKSINENALEYDLWWRPKAQLLKASKGASPFDAVVKLLTLLDQGLWQPSTELLGDLIDSPQIKSKFSEWQEIDLENGWLPIYYNQHIQSQVADNPESLETETTLDHVYKNLIVQSKFDDAILSSDNDIGWFPTDMDNYKNRWIDPVNTPKLDSKLIDQINEAVTLQANSNDGRGQRIGQWLYLLLAEKTVWEDNIEGYPVSPDYAKNHPRFGQLCDLRPLQFMQAEFIKELFSMYCSNWIFNQRQSKKTVLIYDRPCADDNYQWQLIVTKRGQFGGFDHFHVVLAKKLPVKLSTFNVIFQAQFPIRALHEFKGSRYMSNWKVDVKHRYMYVERYIDYIEPLIVERMQGIDV